MPPIKMSPVPSSPAAHPHRRPRRGRPARGRPGTATAGCTAAGTPGTCPGLLARLGELRREEGTADRPFEVHVISMDAFSVDGVRRLEDQGVTDVIVGLPLALRGGARHRAALRQGRQAAAVRRHRDGTRSATEAGHRATNRRDTAMTEEYPDARELGQPLAGGGDGQGQARAGWPVRRRRRGGRPHRPLAVRPRGPGPPGQGGHRRLLRHGDRPERGRRVRAGPVLPVRRRGGRRGQGQDHPGRGDPHGGGPTA